MYNKRATDERLAPNNDYQKDNRLSLQLGAVIF